MFGRPHVGGVQQEACRSALTSKGGNVVVKTAKRGKAFYWSNPQVGRQSYPRKQIRRMKYRCARRSCTERSNDGRTLGFLVGCGSGGATSGRWLGGLASSGASEVDGLESDSTAGDRQDCRRQREESEIILRVAGKPRVADAGVRVKAKRLPHIELGPEARAEEEIVIGTADRARIQHVPIHRKEYVRARALSIVDDVLAE